MARVGIISGKLIAVVFLALITLVAILSLSHRSHDEGLPIGQIDDSPLRRPTATAGNDLSAVVSTRLLSVFGQHKWEGRECMKGTSLRHPKLRKSCSEGDNAGAPVGPLFCAAMANATGDVCGQYAKGIFHDPYRLLSPGELNLRHRLRNEESCNESFAFGQSIAPDDDRREVPFKSPELSFYSNPERTFGEMKELRTSAAVCEHFRYFTPDEVLTILHRSSIAKNGQGILFTGDSITRQLMLRIIAYLRGEERFSEHYFHQDGLYLLYNDHDSLTVLDADGIKSVEAEIRTYFPGYLPKQQGRSGGTHASALLAIMFQWETKPSVYRKQFVEMPNVPLHVAAFMYWWQNKDPLTDIDAYMAAVESLHNKEERSSSRAWKKDYVFITTPWTDPGLFGGVEVKHRLERNAKVTRWIHGLQQSHLQSTRYSLLDYATIAETEHIRKTKDGIHYMCIWTPKYPDVVKMQKYNYLDCRDPMGLAVVQWLAHMVASGLVKDAH